MVQVGTSGNPRPGTTNDWPLNYYWVVSSDWSKSYCLGTFNDAKAKSLYTLVLAAISNGKVIDIINYDDADMGSIGTHWSLPYGITMR